jgi:hypothetical protein
VRGHDRSGGRELRRGLRTERHAVLEQWGRDVWLEWSVEQPGGVYQPSLHLGRLHGCLHAHWHAVRWCSSTDVQRIGTMGVRRGHFGHLRGRLYPGGNRVSRRRGYAMSCRGLQLSVRGNMRSVRSMANDRLWMWWY